MASKSKSAELSELPQFADADVARAREWFKKGNNLREKQNYDYAIESYIRGLSYWPEAVEDGHRPLRSLAIQRAQAGGKKPGIMDSMRKPMTGKDALKAMLNAEELLSKDPTNAGYAEGVLKNAARGGYMDAVQWVAEIVLENLKRDKKPNKSRFKTYRETLVQAAGTADNWNLGAHETFFLEKAVESLEFLIMRMPSESDLKDEQRDLAGKLTIARGKYDDDGDFRDSLKDAEEQKRLHDAERAKQGEHTLAALIEKARGEYEAEPDSSAKLTHLVDLLCREEHKDQEDEAIRVLMDAFERTHNYSIKSKADDVRLRQLTRSARQMVAKARESGTTEDKQQARLAAMEQRQVALDVYRERVQKYPTDLRLKFKLGAALFDAGEYDEALPVLQEAQGDPRSRAQSQLMIGRAFYEKGAHGQAIPVLNEAIEKYELTDDHSKRLLYWLGRAYEAEGKVEEAKDAYGRLLRQDYNYMNGDARKRLDNLNQG